MTLKTSPRFECDGSDPQPRLTIRSATVSNFAIATIILISGIVVFEPAPYELLLVGVLVAWVILGLKIPRSVLPLLFALTLLNIGGILAIFQMDDFRKGAEYIAISYFLALTSVFFAIVIAADGKRLAQIFNLYVFAALISTVLGLLGYFNFPGFGIFTLYGRSAGGFQDPNVYGPYLTVPILYLIYLILNSRPLYAALFSLALGLLLLGLLLAFSRAAWGLSVFAIGIFYFLLIINEHNSLRRLRYIVLAVVGAALIIAGIIAALQVEAISSLFAERVKIVQDYDGGRHGRFARHALGFQLALEKPFGIGQLELEKSYGEGTHNNHLKAILEYGWLGFVCWLAVTLGPLALTFKLMFRPRPWQLHLQIAWVVFFGHQFVGIVIDTDHWRHFYLLIGILWGCLMLEQKWQVSRRRTFMPARSPLPRIAAARGALT